MQRGILGGTEERKRQRVSLGSVFLRVEGAIVCFPARVRTSRSVSRGDGAACLAEPTSLCRVPWQNNSLTGEGQAAFHGA